MSGSGPLWHSASSTAVHDLVVTANHESAFDAQGTLYSDLGATYVFRGGANALSDNPVRLLPAVLQAGSQMGARGVAIGRMRSDFPDNLLLVGVPGRHAPGSSGVGGQPGAFTGAVDAFRFSGNAGDVRVSVFQGGLFPPADAGESLPQGFQSFGSSIAIADLDGDGNGDLIVGAPGADGGSGRVYIFWGTQGATYGVDLQTLGSSATSLVTIFKAPARPSSGEFGDPACAPAGAFGYQIDARDVDGDGKADLVISDAKFPGMTLSCTARPNAVGRVHFYTGRDIPKPTGGTSPNVLTVTSASQTIYASPIHNSAGGLEYQGGSNFGFYLWLVDYNGDNKLDLLVHEETRTWPGTANQQEPAAASGLPSTDVDAEQPYAGSLCMSKNVSTASPTFTGPWFETVTFNGISGRPNRWIFSSLPETGARFGHHVERIGWKVQESLNPEPAILVGEPDHSAFNSTLGTSVSQAGRLHLFVLSQFATLATEEGKPTAVLPGWTRTLEDIDASATVRWMDYTGFGAGFTRGPNTGDCFGRWFTVGRFKPGDPAQQLDQFVVSAFRAVPFAPAPSRPIIQAGAAAHIGQP